MYSTGDLVTLMSLEIFGLGNVLSLWCFPSESTKGTVMFSLVFLKTRIELVILLTEMVTLSRILEGTYSTRDLVKINR